MNKKICWRCPSNIAFVKYWGKKAGQTPANASLSMTLENACTDVSLTLEEKSGAEIELEYTFEGAPHEPFRKKILTYLNENRASFPFLSDFSLHLNSTNSFPHSAGIASSASAFGAIALALLSASGYSGNDFYQQASHLARLGSGSACRSVFPGFALWGKLTGVEDSSDQYAIPVAPVHAIFSDLRDAILIVDDSPKKVSSSAGHSLMKGHYYAESRFRQANTHCLNLLNVIKTGDLEHFVIIIEQEALALHAMMMTSEDYYLLMKPGTVQAIESVMNFRKESKIPVCFTLDAGPNVHVIYPGGYSQQVTSFLNDKLRPDLKEIIFDHIGSGPKKLTC
jgi:diphosphomevalonate decarboxylase